MQFQNQNPEMEAPPPNVAVQTPLGKMRRTQLRWLAEAYGMEGLDFSHPKTVLLPTFEAAEQQGVFRGQAQKPWLLARIQYPDNPEMWPAAPEVIEPTPDPEPEVKVTKLEDMSFPQMQAAGKAAGVNTFGKSWKQIKEEIEALNREMA